MGIGFVDITDVTGKKSYESKEYVVICSKDCKEKFITNVEKQIEQVNIFLDILKEDIIRVKSLY